MEINNPASSASPELLTGETARTWLEAKLGHSLSAHAPVQVLRFSRYSSKDDAIVLLPEPYAAALGEIQDEREKKDAVAPAAAKVSGYHPPKRTRSAKPSRRDGPQCIIEKTSARYLLLISTPTRSSHWGMDVRRLLTPHSMGINQYAQVSEENGLNHEPLRYPEETSLLLKGAFALAVAQTRLQPGGHTKMRLPLIHNQQDGQRYILNADRRSLGSPAMLHIFAYPVDTPPPRLSGWVGVARPEPVERKAGLLLHASLDKRIRFYFPTQAQWTEWRASTLEVEKLPREIAPHVTAAISAAEKIAEHLGYA